MSQSPAIDLPGVLAEIASVAGIDAALKLAAARGGTWVYFPCKSMADDYWLVEIVGRRAAEAIVAHFVTTSMARIKIPLGPMGTRARVWRRIRQMLDAGNSAAVIARTLGIDERTVKRHSSGATGGADPRQGDLFTE
jgi:DNA-binding NarL/FixJ family response regulator